ncbi:peptidoglycan-recognition protein LF-like [Anoplophora glabripennis]|uniref:peptidoglycan-recognition protein LF-like n=1 Tax=Anoplophora glabripennis TaxID=217634 RepID=UPI0008734EB7|nr:peptidoglycan-recognition protein LF-like [Anoplophora glabripennis]
MNKAVFVSISLSLLSLTMGITILILLYTNNASSENCTPAENNDSYYNNKYKKRHQVFDKTLWNLMPRLSYELTNMTSPAEVVIIKQTGGGQCFSIEVCVGKVRSIQSKSISNGLSDIRYNFLIGGDGNIYVGSGWDVQSDQMPNAIDIAFIGSYSFDVLTDSMIDAAQYLLKVGLRQNKLTEEYILVAHNQTMSTESPGSNVYKEIIKWLHYDGRLTGFNSTISERFRIVSRLQWLAQPPTHEADLLKTPVPLVIIHHTSTESCISLAQCTYQVRQIQQFHMESNQWWDIGYSFLVGGDGAVYEGRGWKYEGAHTFGYNYKSIGVAFVGTFNSEKPPKNQIAAFKKLVGKGVELGYLEKDYKILGARQLYGTESPGTALQKEIETWPHWANQS